MSIRILLYMIRILIDAWLVLMSTWVHSIYTHLSYSYVSYTHPDLSTHHLNEVHLQDETFLAFSGILIELRIILRPLELVCL